MTGCHRTSCKPPSVFRVLPRLKSVASRCAAWRGVAQYSKQASRLLCASIIVRTVCHLRCVHSLPALALTSLCAAPKSTSFERFHNFTLNHRLNDLNVFLLLTRFIKYRLFMSEWRHTSEKARIAPSREDAPP